MAGRVLEHLDAATLKLADLKVLVLDEADRMLGADFEMESRAIVEHAPKARQTLFFSAPFPDAVRGPSRQLQTDRKSVVYGKSVSVRVDLGGRGTLTKQQRAKQSSREQAEKL